LIISMKIENIFTDGLKIMIGHRIFRWYVIIVI
jgi:hypothetical protein